MGVFGNLKGLFQGYKSRMDEEYEDEEYEEYEEEEEEEEEAPPPPPRTSRRREPPRQESRSAPPPPPPSSGYQPGGKVVSINTTANLQLVLVQPAAYRDAIEIADHLRGKRTVLLNLETTPEKEGRRILDFLSGVAYAQSGGVKKVAMNTYVITPYDIVFTGDLLEELENSGIGGKKR